MNGDEVAEVDTPTLEEREEGSPTKLLQVESIGRYQLVYQLAAGGMATVYLARAEGPAGFEKLVALKRIHPHLASQQSYIDMFLDEARIASRITHPNVCSVFDFGEVGGEYFIAMEYLVGEPLTRALRRLQAHTERRADPRLPRFAARVVADACEGLHAAHELKDARGDLLGVVHRDVSPQNIFVTFDGSVRVVDFGIARAQDKIHQTRTGEVKGKFAYMAPEQIRDDKHLDRRADVFALGVILWEMLTLRRLFRKKTQSTTMYAVLESEVAPPSSLRGGISTELDNIVMMALARDPEKRYPTARALGQELTQYVSRKGNVFGPADIAEWMAALFPDGDGRARQLLEVARLPREPVPVLYPSPAESSSESLDSFSSTRTVGLPAPAPVKANSARWLGVTGLLSIVLIALAGFGYFVGHQVRALLGGDEDRGGSSPQERNGEPPVLEIANPLTRPEAAVPQEATIPDPASPGASELDIPTRPDTVVPGRQTNHASESPEPVERRRSARRRQRAQEAAPPTGSEPEHSPPARPTDVHGSPIAEDVPF